MALPRRAAALLPRGPPRQPDEPIFAPLRYAESPHARAPSSRNAEGPFRGSDDRVPSGSEPAGGPVAGAASALHAGRARDPLPRPWHLRHLRGSRRRPRLGSDRHGAAAPALSAACSRVPACAWPARPPCWATHRRSSTRASSASTRMSPASPATRSLGARRAHASHSGGVAREVAAVPAAPRRRRARRAPSSRRGSGCAPSRARRAPAAASPLFDVVGLDVEVDGALGPADTLEEHVRPSLAADPAAQRHGSGAGPAESAACREPGSRTPRRARNRLRRSRSPRSSGGCGASASSSLLRPGPGLTRRGRGLRSKLRARVEGRQRPSPPPWSRGKSSAPGDGRRLRGRCGSRSRSRPSYRSDWLLENLLVFAFVGLLVATFRRFQFSNFSYLLFTRLPRCCTATARTTPTRRPRFGFWLRDAFDLARNHYDRIVHFAFGLLLTYPDARAHAARAAPAPASGRTWCPSCCCSR